MIVVAVEDLDGDTVPVRLVSTRAEAEQVAETLVKSDVVAVLFQMFDSVTGEYVDSVTHWEDDLADLDDDDDYWGDSDVDLEELWDDDDFDDDEEEE